MRRALAIALTVVATALAATAWAEPRTVLPSTAGAQVAVTGLQPAAGRIWYPGPHYAELALPDGTRRAVRSRSAAQRTPVTELKCYRLKN